MEKYIQLREGFQFIIKEECRKINIIGLKYNDILIADGWMGVTDFVAVLESGLRNKLGTSKEYKVGEYTTIFGEYKNEFLVHIKIESNILIFDLVEIQQLCSKLNKLLHTANKLYLAKHFF